MPKNGKAESTFAVKPFYDHTINHTEKILPKAKDFS